MLDGFVHILLYLSSGLLFCPSSLIKQYNLVPANERRRSATGKSTTVLVSHWPCVMLQTQGRSQGGRAQPRKLSAPAGFGTVGVGLTWGSLGPRPLVVADVADPLEIRLSPRFSCRIWSF